jgi:hypothetical protein
LLTVRVAPAIWSGRSRRSRAAFASSAISSAISASERRAASWTTGTVRPSGPAVAMPTL